MSTVAPSSSTYGVTGQVTGRPSRVRLAYSATNERRPRSSRSTGQSGRTGMGAGIRAVIAGSWDVVSSDGGSVARPGGRRLAARWTRTERVLLGSARDRLPVL